MRGRVRREIRIRMNLYSMACMIQVCMIKLYCMFDEFIFKGVYDISVCASVYAVIIYYARGTPGYIHYHV